MCRQEPLNTNTPVTTIHGTWVPMTGRELEILKVIFSRSERHRGRLPDAVFSMQEFVAMKYESNGKQWARWGIQKIGGDEIKESWSFIHAMIEPLMGGKNAIEVFPKSSIVLNTAPIRWFWEVPDDDLPAEFNLREEAHD